MGYCVLERTVWGGVKGHYILCGDEKQLRYVGNSIRKLQIQVTTYVFELGAGNCHN